MKFSRPWISRAPEMLRRVFWLIGERLGGTFCLWYLSVSLHVTTVRTCIVFVKSVMNLFFQFAGFHGGC